MLLFPYYLLINILSPWLTTLLFTYQSWQKQLVTYLWGSPASVTLPWNVFVHACHQYSVQFRYCFYETSTSFHLICAALSMDLFYNAYCLFNKSLGNADSVLIALLSA